MTIDLRASSYLDFPALISSAYAAREHNYRPDQQRHYLKWGGGRCFTLCPRVLTPAHGAGWPGQAP